MRIKDILKSGYEFLAGRENALLDCEVILANVLGVEKEYLITHSGDNVSAQVGSLKFGGDLVDLFWVYLKRVRGGEPVAYVTKEKEFYGLNFYVDNRVLVPRPETEQLVETVLNYLDEKAGISRGSRTNDEEKGGDFELEREFESDSDKFRVLDVGTGSGNIAVSLVTNFQNLEVLALDVSDDALEVARVNVNQHGVEDRVELFQSDLLDVLEDGENFHVIVANLPYIGIEINSDVDEGVKKYEPSSALFAGSDGLELYKKMFQQIHDRQIGYDMIVGEFGSMQGRDVADLLSSFFEQSWKIENDLAGLPRMFVVRGSDKN